MKKIWKLVLTSLVVIGLIACSNEPSKDEITIGFVTDTGGIDDNSFNETSYLGLENFAKEIGIDKPKYIESKADADYIPNLSTFAENKVSLLVAAGYKFDKAIMSVADTYPDQKMLVIDVNWIDANKYPNVKQVSFKEQEGSFLVGVVAALKAKELNEDTVGYITGADSTTMLKFYAGYQAGVWAVDENMTILYDNANSFDNIALGKTLAEKQFAKCSVIFHAAGAVGNGVIEVAKEATLKGNEKWVIGVDCDQYEQGYYDQAKTKSVVLTSMLKRIDLAAYDACKEVLNNEFKGGVFIYDFKNNGVGLPDENPNLTKETMQMVQEYKQKVLDGTIKLAEKPVSQTQNPKTEYLESK
ncbi:MAG: BMP family protein [Traorella sp.]